MFVKSVTAEWPTGPIWMATEPCEPAKREFSAHFPVLALGRTILEAPRTILPVLDCPHKGDVHRLTNSAAGRQTCGCVQSSMSHRQTFSCDTGIYDKKCIHIWSLSPFLLNPHKFLSHEEHEEFLLF